MGYMKTAIFCQAVSPRFEDKYALCYERLGNGNYMCY